MEVEKAIEFIRLTRLESGLINERKDYDDIIELLQQGEKYRQMWELLEVSMEGQYCITPIEVYFKKDTINQQMENIKQKYFPKEK